MYYKGKCSNTRHSKDFKLRQCLAGGVGAVFGALPGNSNVEVVEDQKRGQESQGDELVLEAVMAAPKVGDVAIDQCQSQTSIMLGGNDKLNLSAQVVPIEQEVLQLPSVQLDRKEQIEEGDGAPQVLSDKNATGGEGFDGAASNVGNSESNLKDTRDLIVIILSFIHIMSDFLYILRRHK